MPAPENYTFLHVPDPTETVNKNIQMAINVSQAQQQQQMHNLQIQQAQAQLARQTAMREGLAKLAQNPSPQGITQFGVAFPEASEAMARAHGMQSKDDQVATVNHGLQMYNSVVGGRPDVAIELATKWRDAYKAQGRDDNVQSLDSLIKTLKNDPGHAAAAIGIYTSAADPEKWADNAQKATTLGSFQDKAAAEARKETAGATSAESTARYSDDSEKAKASELGSKAAVAAAGVPFAAQNAQNAAVEAGAKATLLNEDAKIAPQLSAAKLAKEQVDTDVKKAGGGKLDIDKFNFEKDQWEFNKNKLPPDMQTKAQDYRDGADSDFESAHRIAILNQKLGALPKSSGASETVEQAARGIYGNQNGYSLLKYEVNDVLNKYKLSGIKSGRLPEAVIKMLEDGVPPANASRSVLEPFLRNLAVVSGFNGKTNALRAYWTANSPQSPLKAARSFSIPSLGITVNKDDDYEKIVQSFTPKDFGAGTSKPAPEDTPLNEGRDIFLALKHSQDKNTDPKIRKFLRSRLKASKIDTEMPHEVYQSRQNDIGRPFDG